jgi:thioesterase domain-containing protein/acyl carrier protein
VRIVGYLIGDADLDPATARAAAEARLPAFSRPTDLVVLAEWPRSPAGKIDRARLPAPVRSGTGSARSDIELRLTQIWQHVLGISSIGPEDDFFALGGHSLLAIRMLGQVRTELDADLPLSIVAERRTVAALAEAIASHGTHVELASPVRLHTSASGKQPLFLAPPITGSVLAYLPLVRRMAADRPVWAFHAPGLHGGRVRFDRFEDLATHYVEELVALMPRGPVMLGGWSMGGAFAIEMAIQLAKRDYEVSTMVLIDAGTPTSYMAEQINDTFGELDDERMAYMYVNNFGRCFGMNLGLDPKQFAGIPASERAKVALAELRRVPAFPPDMDLDRLAAHIAVFTATGQRFIRYLPVGEKFKGRVVHFMAGDGHPEFGRAAYRYDWSEFVEQPIQTIEVPGTHFSLVNEPHVAVLGAELDRALADLP